MAREIVYGTGTVTNRGLTPTMQILDETTQDGIFIDQEFAKAYRATKTVGKADEKVKMAQSMEWLERMENSHVIRFAKAFRNGDGTMHVKTYAAIRYGDHWFLTFESSPRGRMTTTELIIWMLAGMPVMEVEFATAWSARAVMGSKVIDGNDEDPELSDDE